MIEPKKREAWSFLLRTEEIRHIITRERKNGVSEQEESDGNRGRNDPREKEKKAAMRHGSGTADELPAVPVVGASDHPGGRRIGYFNRRRAGGK